MNQNNGRIAKIKWSKPQQNNGHKNITIKCFRCGKQGHPQRLCRIPEHLAKLYQKENQSNTQEAHGIFLENVESLQAYTHEDLIPEAHMILNRQDPSTSSLDDKRTCIVDSGISHTILRRCEYFTHITPSHRQMTSIMGSNQIEKGHGPTTITLPQGTIIHIKLAIYAPHATRNLISFKDIRENGYHIHTDTKKKQEVIHILQNTSNGIEIKERLFAYPLGFYITQLKVFHTDVSNKTT